MEVNIVTIFLCFFGAFWLGLGGNPQKIPSSRDLSPNTDTNCENLFMRPPKPNALRTFLNKNKSFLCV